MEAKERDGLSPPGVQISRVLVAVGGIIVLLAGSLAAMIGFYSWQTPSRVFTPPREFPAPRLFTGETKELDATRAAQQKRLEGERQGDKVVSIPIEQAMQIIAGRGTKAFDPIGEQPAPPPQPKAPAQAPPQPQPPAAPQPQVSRPAPAPQKPREAAESRAKPEVKAPVRHRKIYRKAHKGAKGRRR